MTLLRINLIGLELEINLHFLSIINVIISEAANMILQPTSPED